MEKTYSIEKMRSSLALLEKSYYEQGRDAFLKEIANVPQSYYSNIFFPCKAGKESVIVTDIKYDDGNLYFSTAPITGHGKKKTVRFDEFEGFSVEVARNIIGAIEVAEISEKTTKETELRNEAVSRELEKAEIRKTI